MWWAYRPHRSLPATSFQSSIIHSLLWHRACFGRHFLLGTAVKVFQVCPFAMFLFPFWDYAHWNAVARYFGTGQGWPRHLVDQPGSSLNAFLRSSNFLDSVQVWTRRTAHLRSSATLSFCCKSWVTTHNSVKSVGGGFRPCFLVHAGRRSGSVLSNLISWKFRPTTGCWSCRSPAHERTRQICT